MQFEPKDPVPPVMTMVLSLKSSVFYHSECKCQGKFMLSESYYAAARLLGRRTALTRPARR